MLLVTAPTKAQITTGLSPSSAVLSSTLYNSALVVDCPHLLFVTKKDSVRPVPLSVAPTNGISIDFFSFAY